MPRPADPLSIKAPELAAAPLSMQLAALAEAIADVRQMGRIEAQEMGFTVAHMAFRARALEQQIEAIDSATDALRRIEGESK